MIIYSNVVNFRFTSASSAVLHGPVPRLDNLHRLGITSPPAYVHFPWQANVFANTYIECIALYIPIKSYSSTNLFMAFFISISLRCKSFEDQMAM